MADQEKPQLTRDDANIHLGFTYLREDLQELRQELREITREMNRRFEDVNRRFDELVRQVDGRSQSFDARFHRQTMLVISSNIAIAGAIIAAIKL